jgi:hypothetical protein
VKAAKTAGICLTLAGLALAEPAFRIGTKLTWRSDAGSSQYGDNQFMEPAVKVSYGQEFVGPTIEAEYGPLWDVLSGRLDIAQVSVFTSGGAAFRLFPTLGLDVMVEPPTQWRLKPYAWIGARTAAYVEMPSTRVPVFQHDSEVHWRGGLGAKFALTRRIELFAESQLYSQDWWWGGVSTFVEGDWFASWTISTVEGLVSAEVGARFALGK